MTTISQSRAEELIRQCQQEAEKSIQEGNPPFGCVITDLEGNVFMTAHNTQDTDCDPTAHAEITALRQLGKKLGSRYLNDCVMFANAESCSMCMSASIKAHIKTFYFGAPSEAKMNPWLTVRDVAAKATTPLEINSPILGDECAAQIARGRK
jgi:tRNA(adenine34) deaminase